MLKWNPIGWLKPIVIILVILGLLEILEQETGAWQQNHPQSPLDHRYGSLREKLPADRVWGYLTDAPADSEAGPSKIFEAQYALAPHLLTQDPKTEFVVVDLQNPDSHRLFCMLQNVEPFLVLTNGLILAQRKPSHP